MDLHEAVNQITKEMNLPENFLENLRKDDDWSFIIKAHAFLEAILTHALTESLAKPELAELIANLEISDTRKGKTRFAQALKILSNDAINFVNNFSKLRNDLVHKIENVSFSFSQYIDTLDNNQKKSFIKSFGYFASKEDFEKHYPLIKDLMLKDTKDSILYSLMHFAGVLWWKKENAKLTFLNNTMLSIDKNRGV